MLASWRQDDGGRVRLRRLHREPVKRGGRALAREEMQIHHPHRGEPEVVSVMTYEEWERAILDVRSSIGD